MQLEGEIVADMLVGRRTVAFVGMGCENSEVAIFRERAWHSWVILLVSSPQCPPKFKLWCATFCICPLCTKQLFDFCHVQDDIKKQGAPDPDGTQPMCAQPPSLLSAPPATSLIRWQVRRRR
jgi:hypothetical protein